MDFKYALIAYGPRPLAEFFLISGNHRNAALKILDNVVPEQNSIHKNGENTFYTLTDVNNTTFLVLCDSKVTISTQANFLQELKQKWNQKYTQKQVIYFAPSSKNQEFGVTEINSLLKKYNSLNNQQLSEDSNIDKNKPKEKSNNNPQQNKNEIIFIDQNEENQFHINKGKIGEGATSITYKIIDKKTNMPMCKKVIKYKKEKATIKDAQRAINEFKVMHEITHPCICKAFFINLSEAIEGEDEDVTTIEIFLEFLEHNLDEIVKSKIFTNTFKTRIVLDIVHAMNFIHKHGMMHRDLKIENIMLNSFFETKIVDFGLVRINETVLGDSSSFIGDSLTRGIGTLAYMSPEMINEEPYDNKTDVYSFGVILYFIFFGELPKQSMKDKINGVKIQFPSSFKMISPFCTQLISQCLSHSPLNRPSFEEILIKMRENSYKLAEDIDPSIISKRDKELESYNI